MTPSQSGNIIPRSAGIDCYQQNYSQVDNYMQYYISAERLF